ncbi:rhodanese-like domain-containing protein [Hydrogenovibrio sp. 3SP14C1]|uniref:rhodanese-like domain-containing protein n=1 Tax=Hydrogenovibrio sp. 3SP14C1 TaxID=3038774 RepID=UPI002417C5E5|nr:rhodanese-like domain-containing protein [Hydrogenovibrio sp. 3SP14C1]MDG4811380.1 rhodanese-like domain-containing protein [Hydrogenovibrio sp. 3SP14C1]
MFIEFVEEQIFLFIALGVIVMMLVFSYFGDRVSGYRSVNAGEAVRLYNSGAWVLDVRTDAEYKTGYIGEAENISSTEIAKQPDTVTKHKEEDVLVYCQSGMRSASVAKALVKQGFTNVHNLSGGVMSWKNAGLPLNKPVSKKKLRKEKK